MSAPRLSLALAWIAAAASLAGCMTPHSKPHLSQAVLDARAHRDVPPSPACPAAPLSEVSPVQLGFPFDKAATDTAMTGQLDKAARWLACHDDTSVAIKPDADAHGTPAEQDALAASRAAVVRDYLAAHGIAPSRIRVLARTAPEPSGNVFLIRAEGRRW
jgi:outer membrane protein OmpA-like peptidoglycan-associated protein